MHAKCFQEGFEGFVEWQCDGGKYGEVMQLNLMADMLEGSAIEHGWPEICGGIWLNLH